MADSQNKQELVWQGVTTYPGYNPYNTVLYALMAVSVLYIAYWVIETRDIEFNSSVALHSLPFILLGGGLRFLEDAQFIGFPYNIVLITPIVYILVALVYLPSVVYLEKKQVSMLGTALLVPVLILSLTQFSQFRSVYLVPVLITAAFLTFAYSWITTGEYSSDYMTAVAGSQFFGGSATMYASLYDYTPKQLLAQQFTSIFGPSGILILKTVIVVLAVNLLSDMQDERLKAVTLMTIYAVGLGTGFRVFLRVTAGI